MDVWEYFQSKERECRELSLVPDSDFSSMCAAAEGIDGKRGIFYGKLILTEHAFLNVFELVRVVGTGVHRERYSYYLIINGYEVWGYDRDPDHDPPLHRHRGRDHTRFPCRRMLFREVAREAWEMVSAEEKLGDPETGDEAAS